MYVFGHVMVSSFDPSSPFQSVNLGKPPGDKYLSTKRKKFGLVDGIKEGEVHFVYLRGPICLFVSSSFKQRGIDRVSFQLEAVNLFPGDPRVVLVPQRYLQYF
jgi:hypothetical protein